MIDPSANGYTRDAYDRALPFRDVKCPVHGQAATFAADGRIVRVCLGCAREAALGLEMLGGYASA